MIDELANINSAAIQNMTSASPDRILLPYANTGDVCYHAGQMLADHIGQTRDYPDTARGDRQLCEDVTAMLNKSTITAHLALQPSCMQPRAGLVIDVDTPDGQQLHRSVYAPSGNETAADIIAQFLVAGAPGLCDDVRHSYERQHRAFT